MEIKEDFEKKFMNKNKKPVDSEDATENKFEDFVNERNTNKHMYG